MLKRFVSVVAAFGLIAAACGGDASSCEDIASDTVDLVQDVINEVDQMTPEEVAGQDGDPDFLTDFDEQSEKLADEAASLGCTPEEMSEAIQDKAGSLTAETEFGQFFVQLVQSGEFSGL
jgi:hypothetical protein